jgi:hypothetical protein
MVMLGSSCRGEAGGRELTGGSSTVDTAADSQGVMLEVRARAWERHCVKLIAQRAPDPLRPDGPLVTPRPKDPAQCLALEMLAGFCARGRSMGVMSCRALPLHRHPFNPGYLE